MQSQFNLASNFESSVALDYLAEVTEQLLPPNETNERHFCLLIAVLNYPHAGGSLWAAAIAVIETEVMRMKKLLRLLMAPLRYQLCSLCH